MPKELREYIEELQDEITRLKGELDEAQTELRGAESLHEATAEMVQDIVDGNAERAAWAMRSLVEDLRDAGHHVHTGGLLL
jgi:sugar-specific transcriptional regulator TrmB